MRYCKVLDYNDCNYRGPKQMKQSINDFLDNKDGDKVIDIKLSIENNRSTPDELLQQVKNIIEADKADTLSDFVDY